MTISFTLGGGTEITLRQGQAATLVAVEDDGTSVVAAASTFDFTGDGVTVTDAGNGRATVNVPGIIAPGADVATDPIWDVKGDLAVADGNDSAVRLPVGADGQALKANSATATGLEWSSDVGVTDHGALTGLADDDHTLYSKADGTRAFTGNIDLGGNRGTNAADPVGATDLVTKQWGEANLGGAGGGLSEGTAAGLSGDARRVTDAVLTKDSTTVTSATAAFVAADVNKPIAFSSYRYLVCTASAGSATLTATAGTFLSSDVGRDIEIGAVGTGAVSHTTTITAVNGDGSQATLAVAAVLARTNTVAIVSGHHQTTIQSRTDATTIVLAAAPVWGGTGIEMATGTDNRATFLAAADAAVASGETLLVEKGKHLILLTAGTAATRRATNLLNGNLTVQGAGGVDGSEIIIITSERADNDIGGWRFIQTDRGRIIVRGLTLRMVGPPGGKKGTSGDPNHSVTAVYNEGRDTTARENGRWRNYIGIHNCRFTNIADAADITASSNADAMIEVTDSVLEVFANAVSLFRNTTGGVHLVRIRDTQMRSTYEVNTIRNDTEYNNHLTYSHFNVAYQWENVDTHIAQNTRAGANISLSHGQHIRVHSGNENFARLPSAFRNVVCTGGGQALMPPIAQNEARITRFVNCEFKTHITGPLGRGATVFENCLFQPTQTQNVTGSGGLSTSVGLWSTVEFKNCIFDDRQEANPAVTTNNIAHIAPSGLQNLVVRDCVFFAKSTATSKASIAVSQASNYQALIQGNVFVGETGNLSYVFQPGYGAAGQRPSVMIAENRFVGEWTAVIRAFNNTPLNDSVTYNFENNVFDLSAGKVIPNNVGGGHGTVRGRDNWFNASSFSRPASGHSIAFEPRHGRNPTAATVTSNNLYLPDPNFDFHVVTATGGVTVNNLRIHENTTALRNFGGRWYLLASGGTMTLAHNVGNIICDRGENIVVADGRFVELYVDPRNEKAYAFGLGQP